MNFLFFDAIVHKSLNENVCVSVYSDDWLKVKENVHMFSAVCVFYTKRG